MPEFYRNAWYAQLKKKVDELEEEIQKAIELPTVTSADDGKVLTVDNDGKWAAEDVPKELPVVQTTDEGKVLTVDSSGEWAAEDVPKELPVVQTTDAGKVLTVDSNGQWVANILLPTNYSTDEKVVGIWLDGKPLYQKTIVFSASNTSYSVVYDHEIQNIDLVVSYDAYLIDDIGNCRKLIELHSDFSSLSSIQLYYAAVYRVNRSSIELMYGDWVKDVGYSTYPCYITIQYTKTTV